MPDTIRLRISQGKAKKLKIDDKVRAIVRGEVVGIDGILPIGDEGGMEMPVEVLDATVTLKVTSTKVEPRADDDSAEFFESMSMEENPEDEV